MKISARVYVTDVAFPYFDVPEGRVFVLDRGLFRSQLQALGGLIQIDPELLDGKFCDKRISHDHKLFYTALALAGAATKQIFLNLFSDDFMKRDYVDVSMDGCNTIIVIDGVPRMFYILDALPVKT